MAAVKKEPKKPDTATSLGVDKQYVLPQGYVGQVPGKPNVKTERIVPVPPRVITLTVFFLALQEGARTAKELSEYSGLSLKLVMSYLRAARFLGGLHVSYYDRVTHKPVFALGPGEDPPEPDYADVRRTHGERISWAKRRANERRVEEHLEYLVAKGLIRNTKQLTKAEAKKSLALFDKKVREKAAKIAAGEPVGREVKRYRRTEAIVNERLKKLGVVAE